MKLTGKLTKESKSLNAALSPRSGGGGRVQDVVYGSASGESVVNDEGVAIIPPYPTIPPIPVKGVKNSEGDNLVNEQGIAIIPVAEEYNRIKYGSEKPSLTGNDGDLYLLLNNNKLSAMYLYMVNNWTLINGSPYYLENVLKTSQRNYITGASTFTASKNGYVLCFNQNMNGEASNLPLTASFTTNVTLISENVLNDNYSSPNRNHCTRIALYRVNAGQTITFENSGGGGYTTQLHLAFYIPDSFTITREDFKAQSDNSMGTTFTKALSDGIYFAIGFESSGAGTQNNNATINVDSGDSNIYNIFDNALIGCSVALVYGNNPTVKFNWGSTTNYVTRGYAIYKLTEV